MLTNSNMEEMNKLLGERVMDRMRRATACGLSSTGKVTGTASPARSIKRFPDDDGVILKRFFSHAYESVYEIVKNGLLAALTLSAFTLLRRHAASRQDSLNSAASQLSGSST